MMLVLRKTIWKFIRIYGKLKKIPDDYAASLLLRSFADDYRQHIYPFWKIACIHRKGFTASDWSFLDLDYHDYSKYLTNLQYCRMHPLNGKYGYIIDSKLSLKQHCVGTPLDQYMPEYYFRITDSGKLLGLSDYKDSDSQEPTWNDLVQLLKEKRSLAVKRNAGSIGEGFYKCEYIEGRCFANGAPLQNPEEFFSNLRDYLITEYLVPHPDIAKICPDTANALRYLAGRVDGELQFLKGFIRFGTRASGFVENYNAGGVLCYLDQQGAFTYGNVVDKHKHSNVIIEKHPDSNVELKGTIPCWSCIQKAVKEFGNQFPMLDYLGFDFVITVEEKTKILEINSLTSVDALQLDGSILETNAERFFKKYGVVQ